MAWTTTYDVGEFQARAGEFLGRQAARNNLLLTVAASLREHGSDMFGREAPRFGWCQEAAGRVEGAFVHTPPHPVLLSVMPTTAADALARHLTAAGAPPVTGVNAGQEAAEAFAAACPSRSAAGPVTSEVARLHRLATLTPPEPAPPGRARTATPDDLGLLLRWHEAFSREAGVRGGDIRRQVQGRIDRGTIAIWELRGRPVSFAGATPVLAGMARVAPVYTPPGLRGCGYAGAATAAVSQAALDAGAAEVLLFTDPDNATSNALYQRLGYRPVEDRVVLSLG
jgi:Acetyltransferase (GNAT) family